MPKAFKPNDLQLILLSTASRREGGHLLPLPDSIASDTQRIDAAITALLEQGLICELACDDTALRWQAAEGAVIISDAGRVLIGDADDARPAASAQMISIETGKPPTKIAQVIDLLQRESGATLVELTDATGWLPHTTRAALTGLRKKGHAIEKERRKDVTCYHIAAAS